jgi:hypothetical protein
MCFRFSAILISGAVLAVSTLTHATTPAPAPLPVQERALAQVQAIISYCELVDPLSSAKYQALEAVVLSGQSPSQISTEEKSTPYLQELSTMSARLASVPVSSGVNSCRAAIKGI